MEIPIIAIRTKPPILNPIISPILLSTFLQPSPDLVYPLSQKEQVVVELQERQPVGHGSHFTFVKLEPKLGSVPLVNPEAHDWQILPSSLH